MKKKLSSIFLVISAILVVMVSGCGKNEDQSTSSSVPAENDDVVIETPTSSTKFPTTVLEYYLQSYRDHVLPTTTKFDKKKLKAAIIATGEENTDKKALVVTLYTDQKWNDSKEHAFYIEELKDGKYSYYGVFNSSISKLASEAPMIKVGSVIGEFWTLKNVKVNK